MQHSQDQTRDSTDTLPKICKIHVILSPVSALHNATSLSRCIPKRNPFPLLHIASVRNGHQRLCPPTFLLQLLNPILTLLSFSLHGSIFRIYAASHRPAAGAVRCATEIGKNIIILLHCRNGDHKMMNGSPQVICGS